jgi:hypothetical protein
MTSEKYYALMHLIEVVAGEAENRRVVGSSPAVLSQHR